MNNCNLTTCRYNADGKCTNEEKRKECVRVSKAVLCIDGKSISEFYAKMKFETMTQWKDSLSDICDTNPNCECDPTTCGFAAEYSTFEDVGKGIHRYMCGRDKCKYSKGWKQIDGVVEYGENAEKIDVVEIQKGVVFG